MAAHFSLTQEQGAEFARAGMLRIPRYFPESMMAGMAGRLWGDLHARFGMDRERRETWTKERPAQFQKLVGEGAFDDVADGLQSIADAFLGEGEWERPQHLCLPLVTFPTGRWDVPSTVWHIDQPPETSIDIVPLVRVFVLLERVEPKGGGTCYVAGSHRVIVERAAALGQRLRSADVKTVLAQDRWFAALFSKKTQDRERRFMVDGGAAWGTEVRVCETVGDAGDIYVMHPAMLHTIAENARERPRMMLGQSLLSRAYLAREGRD